MIKLFEEFNQEKLYWEISVDEFPFGNGVVPREKRIIPFTDKEIVSIIEFNKKTLRYPNIVVYLHGKHIGMDYDLHLYKSVDDYYYVIRNSRGVDKTYYKCDEIEGLFNCIRDLADIEDILS